MDGIGSFELRIGLCEQMKILDVGGKPFHELEYHSSGRGGLVRDVVLPFYKIKVDELPEGIRSVAAVSDLQGREKDTTTNRLVGEAVSDELVLLQELQEIPPIDLVFLAGDFYDYPDCRKLGGTGDVTTVWNAFAQNFEVVVGVHGNHDIVQENRLLDNVIILDGEIKQVAGLTIGGVSGIVGRSDRNQRKTDVEFQKALKKSLADKTQVLLLHQGPDDPANNQIGDPAIREFLESNGASVVIFGHCRWDTPFVQIGANQVLNVDNRLCVFHE